jgi:hypothetical protein
MTKRSKWAWSKSVENIGLCFEEKTSCFFLFFRYGQFGFLFKKDQFYKIKIHDSEEVLNYNSVDELISTGWVVD